MSCGGGTHTAPAGADCKHQAAERVPPFSGRGQDCLLRRHLLLTHYSQGPRDLDLIKILCCLLNSPKNMFCNSKSQTASQGLVAASHLAGPPAESCTARPPPCFHGRSPASEPSTR